MVVAIHSWLAGADGLFVAGGVLLLALAARGGAAAAASL
jgi:hypothetical protein